MSYFCLTMVDDITLKKIYKENVKRRIQIAENN